MKMRRALHRSKKEQERVSKAGPSRQRAESSTSNASSAGAFASTSNGSLTLQALSDDLHLGILSYLNTADTLAMMQTSSQFYNLIGSSETLWRQQCRVRWPFLRLEPDTALQHDTTLKYPQLLRLASKHQASSVDEAPRHQSIPVRLILLQRLFNGYKAVSVHADGNRCFRAKEPLPKPVHRTKRTWPWQRRPHERLRLEPFVAPYLTSEGLSLQPRLFAYFEVDIVPHEPVASQRRTRFAPPASAPTSSCVAVGLGSDQFKLDHRLPGWDDESIGYHGDDGGLFHGTGARRARLGPKFGPGDVVGCGIDYRSSVVFFTHNGRLLSRTLVLNKRQAQAEWYPVVGMDSESWVSANFGVDRPFRFDLQHIAKEPLPVMDE